MVYFFADYQLTPAIRELSRNGEPVQLPRRTFDCIVYLIEHRDRAVGRDELTSAVWGRVDVTDAQLNQVMLQARRAVGDSGEAQQAIRTLPGFGYHWVLAVDEASENAGREGIAASSAPGAERAGNDGDGRPAATPSRRSRPWRAGLAALFLIGLIAILLAAALVEKPASSPSATATADDRSRGAPAVVVLPLQVDGPRESGWVRLGAMDLIADRLRTAGLPVPPSESVLIALHGFGEPPDADARRWLQRTLAVSSWVEGKASRSSDGWKIELDASDQNGMRHAVHARHADVAEAARQAADLLLAALGKSPPPGPDGSAGFEERLQQVRAALLSGELEAASDILAQAASTGAGDDPRVRLYLAQFDARAGRFDEAEAAYTRLIEDPTVRADPLLHARVLSSRGGLRGRRTDFSGAERDFDAAVNVLDGRRHGTIELARALNGRGVSRIELRRFDEAATDLGRARIGFQQAGDQLGLLQSDTNLGLLEAERGRMEQALPYLLGAADRFDTFGAAERMLAVLVDVFDVQAALLRWPQALAATERQWPRRDRAGDPGLGLLIGVNRATALTALGRLREAEAILADMQRQYDGIRAEALRHLYAAQAELAWRQGRAEAAAVAAEQALSRWPADDPADGQRARIVLLRQRALIAVGRFSGANEVVEYAPDRSSPEHERSPVLTVAAAESAAQRGRSEAAERLFRQALGEAEARGVPADIALAAQAYGYWLIGHGRVDEAGALAGRISPWAASDFDCALLQLAVLHAHGGEPAWAEALRQAQALAGERAVPSRLAVPPAS